MRIQKIPFLFFMFLFSVAANAQMVLQYDIATANNSIALPLNGTVNVQVDWGDGSAIETFVTPGSKSHIYTTVGIKTVTITGILTWFGSVIPDPYYPNFGNSHLIKVLSWDGLGLTSLSNAFDNAMLLDQVPTSLPSTVTDLSAMFSRTRVFNQPIGNWNTSAVTNMSSMFIIAEAFNQPIGNWNTSAVTNMSRMFRTARNFNQPIDTWNTSAVTNMHEMFCYAEAFNQPIGNWNTSAVTDMSDMFDKARLFNQPIGTWNTSSVTNMSQMFFYADAFNQPIGTWNTSAVTNMSAMFRVTKTFNQPIGNWNTSAVTNMRYMFSDAEAFNQPLGNWNTNKVMFMTEMFRGAGVFNQSIGSWNTSAVRDMSNMFRDASEFNQPLGNWNTSAVTNMAGMFYNATVFNQPIGNWNTSAVANMSTMFNNASAFNQPLGNWNISAVTNMTDMFYNTILCTDNYDATLKGWALTPVKSGVNFNGGGSMHSIQSKAARASLISKGWSIMDGGLGFPINAKCDNGSYYNSIHGTIYTDANADCIKQITETPISSVLVKAMPGPYYGYADSNGNYEVRVDTGTASYTLTQQFNGVNAILLKRQCAPAHIVSLKGASIDTASFDFANEVRACALPTIDIQHMRLIRCFRSSAYIQYCNLGNTTLSNAAIKVEYPAHVIPLSSVPMWSSKAGSTLYYDIATLEEANCGRITIIDSLDCDPQVFLGLTQCVKATISPKSACNSSSPLWDFSSTEVSGSCNDNKVLFVLTNSGDGDMADSLAYHIFVNDTLIYNGTYKLLSGATLEVRYPAQAQTVRLEADQHPNHPGNSHPKAIVESCGTSATGFVPKGLVTTTPQDDLDEEVAIVCSPIRGSFDPNDKQAAPTGVGVTHQVAPGTEIEYTIRFQNTGTAQAATVKVVDTLDAIFDPASFVEGVSSHPYTLKVTGKGQAVLTYTFNNINLPDSTTDKLGSNGLVSFRITIPSDAGLGTVIHNKAYIYFDYNDGIITNSTMHTVGITTAKDLSKGQNVYVGKITTGLFYSTYTNAVKVYPNPSEGMITIELREVSSNMEFRLVSVVGVPQKTIRLTNTMKQEVGMEGVGEGMYLYEIWKDGERTSVGKIQIR